MVAGPGGSAAAGRGAHGHLRASHADREHVISTLKAAFVQGRLTKDELDERVGQTLASRTHGELAALTADSPARPAAAPAAPASSQPRPVARGVAKAGAFVAIGPAVLAAAFYTSNDEMFKWLITMMIVYYMALMVAGAVMLDSWQQGSSPRLPPSRPAGRCRSPGVERRGRAGPELSLRHAHGHVTQRGRGSLEPRRAGRNEAGIRATAL